MATLQKRSIDFNRKVKISNDGGELSSDTGELLFLELDEKLGFFHTLDKHLHLKDERQYHFHSNEHMLHQKIYQMIASYARMMRLIN
ncbi:transposase [Salicibibacter cibarius]|uniref:Transposase n=1 Tax=Salicibibacter cibarius TaxID=2743000 RepID=A0A7T6Z0Q0_9BACI|nr:transposase [Salicibibacter cibarius]